MQFNGCNKCVKANDPTKGNCFMSATGYKECMFDMFKEMDHYVCACGKCVEVKELKSTMGEKCF